MFARVVPSLADVILVNGHATIGAYPGLRRVADRLTVYYPIIDEERFRPGSARQSHSPVLVGMAANINPDKGIEVFVEAAALLARNDSVRFVLVGAEHETHRNYARRLRARVDELGLNGRFQFAGEQSDVATWMRDMDVFVISSNFEGSTTTAIEAMAVGLPVVATDVGAVGEVVIDGETGVLVPRGDHVALAAATERLANDPKLRSAYGAAGRRRFDERFAARASLGPRVALYRRAIARGRHRRRRVREDRGDTD